LAGERGVQIGYEIKTRSVPKGGLESRDWSHRRRAMVACRKVSVFAKKHKRKKHPSEKTLEIGKTLIWKKARAGGTGPAQAPTHDAGARVNDGGSWPKKKTPKFGLKIRH